jgi:DNA sulfur modification protein DndC
MYGLAFLFLINIENEWLGQPWKNWNSENSAIDWAQKQLPTMPRSELEAEFASLTPANGKKAIAWVEHIKSLSKPDHEKRDWRRMNGKVYFYQKKNEQGGTITLPIPGPYIKEWRHHWLRRVLKVQKQIQENAPSPFGDAYQIITNEELSEIRRIWRDEKNEFEDALPKIYQEIMGVPFVDPASRSDSILDDDTYEVLLEVALETNIEKIKQLLSTKNTIQQPQQLTLAAIIPQESEKTSDCIEGQISDLKDAIASSDSPNVGDKQEYTSWAAIKFAKKQTGAHNNAK